MPAQNPNANRAESVKPRKATKRYVKPPSPSGDRPQTRKQDFKKAATYKKTAGYRGSVRAAYASKSIKERVKDSHLTAATPSRARTAEGKAILRLHRTRLSRDRQQLKDVGFLARSRYGYTPKADKYNVMDKHSIGPDELALAHKLGWSEEQIKQHGDELASGSRSAALGFHKAGLADKLMALPIAAGAGAITSAAALGEATYHDPVGVPTKTAKQAVLAVPAALGGTVELVRHPKKTIKQAASAVEKDLNTSYKDKVKRIRKEGGLQDLVDASLVVAPAGSSLKAALPTIERAGLRTTGGVVLEQTGKHGLVRDAIGHQLDKRRGKKLEKELVQAEEGSKPMDAVRQAAAQANRKAGKVVEVTPRKGYAATRRIRQAVAKRRGKGVYMLRHDQAQRVGAAEKTINKLDKNEKRAMYYASALGIRTPEQATALLPKLRQEIVAGRARHNITKVPGSLKKSDMLPEIDAILADPAAHFTPKLADAVEQLRPDSLRAAAEDPRLLAGQASRRRHAQQRQLVATPEYRNLEAEANALRESIDKKEVHGDDLAKTKSRLRSIEREQRKLYNAEVTKHGLAEPLYFKSERYVGPTDYAARALGAGKAGAMRKDFKYTGKNFEVGLQDTSTGQYLRGLSRNIKAKHNWNQVADLVDEHRLDRLAPAEGLTLSQLRDQVHRQGIDEGSIAYWNPTVFRSHAHEANDVFAAHGEDLADTTPAVSDAIKQSEVRFDGEHVATPEHLATTGGWQAVPREMMAELERQTTPSRAASRAWDVAKGKASRAILLTGNVPWATFQVASNALMTTAATKGRVLNPANWLGAAKWWHELSHEERNRIGATMGLDSARSQYTQTHLGASTNNDMVNAYRAFKAHPFFHTGIAKGKGPSISELNPLELMAKFDASQNNVARILTTYTGLKQEAARQMSSHIVNTTAAQDRLMAILSKKDVRDQINSLAKDPGILEKHAEAVHDWLGDYTNMTAAERKGFNRAIMFYPYLRYSLKLVFYTMPVKHPVMTAILGELGQLHADDVKQLLGGKNVYWDLGKVYFNQGGHATSIDLRRANPALNALFDAAGMKNPKQLIGMLPPYVGWAADQMFQQNTFANRDWRVHGKAAPYGGAHVPLTDFETRGRILLNQALGIFYPYREADKMTAPEGTMGDDSLAFDRRPVKFKGRTYLAKMQRKAAENQQAFNTDNKSLLHELVPLIPAPNRDVAAGKDQAAIERARKHPKGRKKATKYFGAGGTSSLPKLNGGLR